MLDEAVVLGRASDEAARAGRPVAVPDLLDTATPAVMVGGGHRLTVDPATGTSTLEPVPPQATP